jgi:tetratricopeptide (TPR) repeat protein
MVLLHRDTTETKKTSSDTRSRPKPKSVNCSVSRHPADLPVLFGVRLLLSFPGLIAAVRLYGQGEGIPNDRPNSNHDHDRSSPDPVIEACMGIIRSGQENTSDLAGAFNNRGHAYNVEREYDRAIQDFDQAIRLDPNNVLALNDRGTVYNSKHEYDQAIQDLDQCAGAP